MLSFVDFALQNEHSLMTYADDTYLDTRFHIPSSTLEDFLIYMAGLSLNDGFRGALLSISNNKRFWTFLVYMEHYEK